MSEQTPSSSVPGLRPGSGSDRDLILEALRQAAPRGRDALDQRPLPPPESFPGYEILREVHRGGQGVVYQAIQTATKRRVAIKVLYESPLAGSASRARFEREVQVLGQLSHPNIVRIHDSGVTPTGRFFYVMDYIAGRPLDEHINASKAAPDGPDLGATLRLFVKICDAVNAAHLKGVIHRDLKPGNIRLDAQGEPVLVDFGLARVAVPGITPGEDGQAPRMMTATGQFVGSLPWASPEQAEGTPGAIDLRTDVYSLGVILYQMLTGGRFPYEVVGNMRQVLSNIMHAAPARPSTVRKQINDEVETIVLKCLSKERDRRYQSAGELARDIERYLNGQPIEAKRDSGLYVLGKTLRRYRVAAGVGLAFVLLAVVSAGALAVLYNDASRARAQAEANLKAERAQRQRADENLDALRELSRTFMFDFHERIRNLRGSTRAREALLAEALKQVERLAGQAGERADLLLELADAHDMVGDLKGGLYMPRLGAVSDAAEHYEKASGLRASVRQRDPDDARAAADLAVSSRKLAGVMSQNRRYAEARARLEQALNQHDQAARLAGADAALTRRIGEDRARSIRALADVIALQAENATDEDQARALTEESRLLLERAGDYWRSRLDATPQDEEAAQLVGVIDDRLASLRILLAARAERALRRLPDDAAPDRVREAADRSLEWHARARESALASASRFEALSAASPENAAFRRDLYLAYHNIGLTFMESAQMLDHVASRWKDQEARSRAREAHEQALRWYEKALAITRALADADEANLEARRDLAACLNKAGNQHASLERLDEAQRLYTLSMELRADLFATDPTQMHRRDLALGRFKLGQNLERLAERPGLDAPERRRLLSESAEQFRESVAGYQALREAGVLAEDSPELTTSTRLLVRVRGKLEKLGP